MPAAPLARCALRAVRAFNDRQGMPIVGRRDGMGRPCGKERAHEDVRVPEKPERAHM